MKNIILTIALIAGLVYSQNAKAQAFLSVHPTSGVGYHGDTVIASSVINFPVVIENTGNTPLFGPTTIELNIGLVDSLGALVLLQTDTVSIPQGNMLSTGDTVMFSVAHLIDMQKYTLAGNTTVIWPIAPGLDNDTATGVVYVIEPNGFVDHTGKEHRIDIRCYPNPTNDYLYLDVPAQAELESVRMIDLTGKTVREFRNMVSLPVGDLPSGIYFAELVFRSGQIQTYKIIKGSH